VLVQTEDNKLSIVVAVVLKARIKPGSRCSQFLCLILINAMSEKVLSHKDVDVNGSKAVTTACPREG
jgi:hypothetical protein